MSRRAQRSKEKSLTRVDGIKQPSPRSYLPGELHQYASFEDPIMLEQPEGSVSLQTERS